MGNKKMMWFLSKIKRCKCNENLTLSVVIHFTPVGENLRIKEHGEIESRDKMRCSSDQSFENV